MFWRSVVGKLAMTILLLVSFVLFILTVLLLEFFENFHVQEAEKAMMQAATKVSLMVEQHEDNQLLLETAERVKDPSTQVVIMFENNDLLISKANDQNLSKIQEDFYRNDNHFNEVLKGDEPLYEQRVLPNGQGEVMVVGIPVEQHDAAVFVYQSLDVINQTKAETTRIIFLAAGIAIVLTTIFAFFLSTRITAPLIKMRKAAFDLAKGEFDTKVPILTNDEIGELATAFNRMGKQLKFHITALRQEKEQLSSVLSSMADGVITLDRDGNMLVTNPPANKFMESLNFEKNIRNVGEDKQLPKELLEILQKVISEEKEVLHEMTLQGRNYVMLMTPLYDQAHVRGAVAVIRDMTEDRKLDKLRKDFIANVSHELRTPISLLQGYSEAIVDDIAETPEEKNELAKIIQEESLRMGRLVNELLDIARIEAGHVELNLNTVEINSFVERIIKKFRGITDEHLININLHQKISKSTSYIDPDRIEQVLTNFVDNAIRHTEDHGEIDVYIENNDQHFHAEVTDNGIGIPEEDLPFIFERFYKADKSRKRNSVKKGTGLGLSIAKNIIETHSGTISVRSKLNVGTTFSFTIQNE